MRELALFAGYGGGLLASHLLGWETVCAVESNPTAIAALLQRQSDKVLPAFPIWDDVATFDGYEWKGKVDVVSGGFPCQPFSTASRGRRVAVNRWPDMRRIIAEVEPSFVFAENVSQSAIDTAACELESLGYTTKAVALSAADLGADHIRERYWLLAYTYNQSQLLCEINAEMGVCPCFCHRVWSPEPWSARVADGVAGRMERYKATGNGQVPIVAATAWRVLFQSIAHEAQ